MYQYIGYSNVPNPFMPHDFCVHHSLCLVYYLLFNWLIPIHLLLVYLNNTSSVKISFNVTIS